MRGHELMEEMMSEYYEPDQISDPPEETPRCLCGHAEASHGLTGCVADAFYRSGPCGCDAYKHRVCAAEGCASSATAYLRALASTPTPGGTDG